VHVAIFILLPSLSHTENVIVNTDDLLCLQLHILGEVHPTFYEVQQTSAKYDLHADNMNSAHKTKED